MTAPSVIQCPKCFQRLKVEFAKTYKCPKCGTLIATSAIDGPSRQPASSLSAPEPRPSGRSLAPFDPRQIDDEADYHATRWRSWAVATLACIVIAAGIVGATIYLRDWERRREEAAKVAEEEALRLKEAEETKIPRLLPDSTKPRELSGDEVYQRLLRSTALIVTPRKLL